METPVPASRYTQNNRRQPSRVAPVSVAYTEDQVHTLDFVRTRLRGTSERITLYEIDRIKPESRRR
jgi:hypothetical protein